MILACRRFNRSYRHRQSFRLGQHLLVFTEGEELLGLHDQGHGDVEDTAPSMAAMGCVGSGKSFGFIDDIREVAELDSESAADAVGFKLGPEESSRTRSDPLLKLDEAERIAEFILAQRGKGFSHVL
jgi:hypothetical protein